MLIKKLQRYWICVRSLEKNFINKNCYVIYIIEQSKLQESNETSESRHFHDNINYKSYKKGYTNEQRPDTSSKTKRGVSNNLGRVASTVDKLIRAVKTIITKKGDYDVEAYQDYDTYEEINQYYLKGENIFVGFVLY